MNTKAKMQENLAKAVAKRAENARLGIKAPNPIERAKQNPTSRKFATHAMCYDCVGREPGWRNEVKNCTAPECPLYNHRPGRSK